MTALKGLSVISTSTPENDLFSHSDPHQAADWRDPASQRRLSRENLFSEAADPPPVPAAQTTPPPRDPFNESR